MRVLVFIPELHCNLIATIAEKFFAETVVPLLVPFLRQKRNYLVTPYG